MKVTTNQKLVESRTKWAKRIAPLTMIFLIGGLITNFLSISQPQYFQPTLILLALGFISAIVSSHLVNHWVREPRADQVLAQMLKKFGNDYLLFNYTSPVPHVLVAPDGVYVIIVKNHDGQISVNGRRFSRKFTWRRLLRVFADEGLGSPIRDAERQVDKLRKLFRNNLPQEEEVPELKPMVLFTNKDVELTVNDPDIPVLQSNELKAFLREEGKNRTISSNQRKELASILAGE